MTGTRRRPGGLISPDAIWSEMRRIRAVCAVVDRLAITAGETYEELYDAGLRQSSSGSMKALTRSFQPSDPTMDVVLSGMHAGLRGKARRAAGKLRKIETILSEAEALMLDAFAAATDPEFREKLERLRELEAAAESHA